MVGHVLHTFAQQNGRRVIAHCPCDLVSQRVRLEALRSVIQVPSVVHQAVCVWLVPIMKKVEWSTAVMEYGVLLLTMSLM